MAHLEVSLLKLGYSFKSCEKYSLKILKNIKEGKKIRFKDALKALITIIKYRLSLIHI